MTLAIISSFMSINVFVFIILSAAVLTTRGLVCFSSFCPNGELPCNDYCSGPSDVCHLISHSLDFTNFNTVEMGCSHSTLNCSQECNLAPINIGQVHYCCCTKDFCNYVSGETDHLFPTLEIGTEQPSVPPPPSTLNYTVCEEYRCKPDEATCFHGYKVCEESSNGMLPYCSSSYTINNDLQLELLVKGCEYEVISDCTGSNECHVDNPLNGQENEFYMCCCNKSLCNQNETFTHPTEHFKYGFNECQNLSCHHSCLIENNQPRCVCDDGFVLDESSQCIDIDECALELVQCDLNMECVNSNGGFECVCKTGYYYATSVQKCLDDDGIECEHYNCTDYSQNSTCMETVEHCSLTAHETLLDPKYHFCQATYLIIDGVFHPRFSTCLQGPHSDCNNTVCKLIPSDTIPDHFFCCCYGDFCNARNYIMLPDRISVTMTSTTDSTRHATVTSTDLINTSSTVNIVGNKNSVPDIFVTNEFIGITIAAVLITLLIVFVIAIIGILKYYNKQKNYVPSSINDEIEQSENRSPYLSEIPILDTVIGQGRFAKVYCTTLKGQQVAIKIFNNTFQARESWSKEKEIYSTPELQHPNILRFLDADRHMHEGTDAFQLIFEYQPNGSLYDYLQHCTVSLQEFSVLSRTATCGLAHLHSEISQGNVVKKPAIAHRDLKSKNILVKSDMTSCISDFGLAIKLNQGEHPSEAQGQVGTSRYMAPEVLEGAISFHQESFLRIDVYAFGLVLWEMASRCDIPGNLISEYGPPFEDIVSPNPSIEEMKNIVADQQKRPEIPRGFIINSEYQSIVDTITESWDPEAEARPSAHLIETRLDQFCDFIDPLKKHNHKESAYLSSHHTVPSPINITTSDNPLPLTPSSSPCVTLSPSDTKTMQFDCPLPDQLYFNSSYHSVVDSGNMSDELRDGYNNNNNSRPSVLTAQRQTNSPLYHSNIDCHDGMTATNTMNQLETSI